MYLSDGNLTDDEESITEPKRKRKQKLMSVQAPKATTPLMTEVNQVNTFDKKRLNDTFYEGKDQNENVQGPENNDSCDHESDWKVSDFLSSEDSCDQRLPSKLRN